MNNQYIVNCYCFNKSCNKSIFHISTCVAVRVPFSKVLSEKLYCQDCGEELVSKQLLNMRMEIDDLVNPMPISA